MRNAETLARPTVRRAKIIVIDSDQSMRELLDAHLRNAGYQVFVAADAVDGGRIVLERGADLIICDPDTPCTSGYEFLSALKIHPTTRTIPVVLISAREDAADDARKLGAVSYLTKPFTADRLLQVVELYGTVS